MTRRYQVFVSSTYEDLVEERRHVLQALLETHCIPVGMELFPASTEEKWALIRRLIDDCDYFIVIVAGKFGNSPMPDGPSYTEMEFDYAKGRDMTPIGFFHADLGGLASSKCESSDAARRKLESFTAKVKEGMCARWKSPSELGSAVKSAMINAFELDPKPGWVKAKSAAGAAELASVRETADAANIAAGVLGEEVLKIPVVDALQFRRRERVTNVGIFNFKLRNLFAAISRNFDDPKPAAALRKRFIASVAPALDNMNLSDRSTQTTAVHWMIEPDFFDRILKTFMAKGLLTQVSPPKHLQSRRSKYWQLTSSGRQERARLEALV